MKKIQLFILAAIISVSFFACLKEDINPSLGVVNPIATAEQIRAFYKGTDVDITTEKLSGSSKISGVIISDAVSKNTVPGNITLQNFGRGNVRGITIELGATATHPFVVGDSVEVDLVGSKLTSKRGVLLLTGIAADKIKKLASNATMSVKQITIAELAANFSTYEGTLVKVNADVKPTPVSGDTYAGDKGLNDGTSANLKLHTEAAAVFSASKIPASAAFAGIATYGADTSVKQLWMRNINDVSNASGPLYTGYPEDFESPDFTVKSGYAAANVALKTGSWLFDQALLGNTGGRDRFNAAGLQCVRMQQNLSTPAYLQMNYDLLSGATKVTFTYGIYYTDAGSTFRLEYSTNSGVTWLPIGPDVSDAPNGSKGATYLMNITGKVRFRINKLGLGTTGGTILNGRLCIEDFAVYQNL
jgi:hypothetical protein